MSPDAPRIKRLDAETEPAWAAFLAWAELGPGRTYDAAREALGRPRSYTRHLKRWAKRHNWRARADHWDEAELAEARTGRIKLREQAYQALYDKAGEAAQTIVSLMQGDHRKGSKPSVQLQAAIHALAQAGMVPPKRTELIVDQGDGLDAAREALSSASLAQLEAILALPDDPAAT
jgi:hypothetical protein